MSQIASFYLIKNNQRQELSDGDSCVCLPMVTPGASVWRT